MAGVARPLASDVVPPLEAGDVLTREEFERRWELNPEIKRAELIDGVVFVEASVGERHGEAHAQVVGWLGAYRAKHPELQVLDNATVRFAGDNSLQPDALLRRREGGMSVVGADGCIAGPPELIVEIAASSASYDLHAKREVYRREGVREYIVIALFERKLEWFVLEGGAYRPLEPDERGRVASAQFEGLALDVPALLAGDLGAVLAAL